MGNDPGESMKIKSVGKVKAWVNTGWVTPAKPGEMLAFVTIWRNQISKDMIEVEIRPIRRRKKS